MKRFWLLASAVALAMGLMGCGTANAAVSESTPPAQSIPTPSVSSASSVAEENVTGGKTLIVYYSLVDLVPEDADAGTYATPAVGNTKAVAEEIQRQVGGDLFAIQTVKTYPVLHREASAIAEQEAQDNVRPELAAKLENIADYDTIYLGYPLWWYQEPMAVRTFLESYDFSGKTIIPFCTSLGATVEKSVSNIKELCPDTIVQDGMTFHTGQQNVREPVEKWLNTTKEDAQMKIRITVGDTVLYATLEDNATTRAWTAQMPLTLPMSDLYGREMCYRYGGGAMPTDSLRYDGYEVGDIAYWPPRGSLVILYAQNGEEFERQHLGHVDSGVEVFATTGNADVTFELAD